MSSLRRLPPVRSLAAVCALGASALLLTACGSSGTDRADVAAAAPTSPGATSATATSASPSASASLSEDQTERKDLINATKVTWQKAADAAIQEVPDSQLVGLELKPTPSDVTATPGTASPSTPNPAPSPGAPEWEAKVATEDGTVHRVEIDAVNGKVFRSQAEQDQSADDKQEIVNRLNDATQAPDQVVKAATDKVEGTVTGLELDHDDNDQVMWSVDVVNNDTWVLTSVEVDAASGEVLREQVERD
ncbi:PepSY domain-containing protein [Streptomyces sp. SID7958]|uniref:PepSY domain-containing protein n=2 Tax=unclassified Streptomyces TaxID=2593676 RepID=A0A6G3R3J1_9ACTN|nr:MULTISPECIES: PepSY domain-containing protein [unclassified Streptomyces]NEA90313.1 PepSY domain-containing protein [Streptomyces sp. SID14436]NEC83920.1 PepSY domain-containing protein [Streptomyces sp. SID7958]